MTTRSLLWWVALLGGAELALQGHLRNQAAFFHAGAWLAALALASGAWRGRGRTRAAHALLLIVPVSLSLLAAAGLPAEQSDPLIEFWRRHAADRQTLGRTAAAEPLGLFGQRIELDAMGFRPQSAPPAGAYRIVVVGGSNTFGVPLEEEGPTWPERLQSELAALGCRTPVAVFNGGRTGRGVPAVVRGFDDLVAELAPDLLLVYPSPADLFGLSESARPEIGSVPLPSPRTSTLLAGLERTLRVRPVARAYRRALAGDTPSLETEALPLGLAYRRLVVKARRRGIDVALVNPSLALNADSPESLVRRYEELDPRARHAVLANRLHGRLVRQAGASYRALILDPGEGLDGTGDESFLDLFHLKSGGRERLARNLRDSLRPKLAQPEPGCPGV